MFVVVLVVADNICEVVNDFLIILDQFGKKGQEVLIQPCLKVLIDILFNLAKPFIELFGRIDIFFQFHPSVVDLDKFMYAHEEGLLLDE